MADPINMKSDDSAGIQGQTAAGAQQGQAGAGSQGAQGQSRDDRDAATKFKADPALDHANNPAIPEHIRKYWQESEAKYVIPRLVRDKYPQLVPLIRETESMNDEEREYWFQILPIMTETQIQKFVGILENEKSQLQKLDKEYQGELTKLNDKHQIEWDSFEAKEKREELQKKEAQHQAAEAGKEAELLSELDNI